MNLSNWKGWHTVATAVAAANAAVLYLMAQPGTWPGFHAVGQALGAAMAVIAILAPSANAAPSEGAK